MDSKFDWLAGLYVVTGERVRKRNQERDDQSCEYILLVMYVNIIDQELFRVIIIIDMRREGGSVDSQSQYNISHH